MTSHNFCCTWNKGKFNTCTHTLSHPCTQICDVPHWNELLVAKTKSLIYTMLWQIQFPTHWWNNKSIIVKDGKLQSLVSVKVTNCQEIESWGKWSWRRSNSERQSVTIAKYLLTPKKSGWNNCTIFEHLVAIVKRHFSSKI